MASFLASTSHLLFSTDFRDHFRSSDRLLLGPHSPFLLRPHRRNHRPSIPREAVVRAGFQPDFLPDPESAEGLLRGLLGRIEGLLYTIADAADSSAAVASDTKQTSDWFSGITHSMENVLKVLHDGLSAMHVPYSYGFAIILLTFIVKAATFPLTKKQVESAMAMRSLQPQIHAIQQRYAGDQERIQIEIARLYRLAGINPLAGCLPTLFTIPVWIGLYRALSNVANEGLLTEGFFWIPSLSGPTTIAVRQSGNGISWLFPFVNGHPPLGWSDTLAYLVLPVLLVVSQYISVQIMQASQRNDPNLKNSQAITRFLPLMIGYFALSVPSGLSLYWFTNNMLSAAQQVWLQKLGGATTPSRDFSDIISRDDQSQFQKSVPGTNSSSTGASQGKKLTPKGLRPGERFNRIKEQEARRRLQREEEKKWALEAADNLTQTSERHRRDSEFVEVQNGGEADLVDVKNERLESMAKIPEPSNGVVNEGVAKQDWEEDRERTAILMIKNGGIPVSTEVGQSNRQHLNESFEQNDDVVEMCTTATAGDRKLSSGEHVPQAMPETHARRED